MWKKFLKGWCNIPPLQKNFFSSKKNCKGGPLRFVKKIVRGTITICKKMIVRGDPFYFGKNRGRGDIISDTL